MSKINVLDSKRKNKETPEKLSIIKMENDFLCYKSQRNKKFNKKMINIWSMQMKS